MATPAGLPLLRLAAQTRLLESEALAEAGGGTVERTRIAIAVNADSMSTWSTAVLGELTDVLFDVRIEDQDHSARLLREGAVMGAVTTERNPVPGCRVQSLGLMRYVPVAGPGFVERYLSGGFTVDTVRAAPSLAWNRDDALQDMLVRKAFRRDILRLVHFVPTADGFGSARAGQPWLGHVPRAVGSSAASRRFVRPYLRCASRCAVVLAVLGARQPDRQCRYRRRADSRCGTSPESAIVAASGEDRPGDDEH